MAIHLKEANAIFYEIPKCGTSFIRHALTELGIEWEEARVVDGVCPRHSLPEHYPGDYAFRFCSVRHPINWYESYWRFERELDDTGAIPYRDDRWYAHRVLGERMAEEFHVFMEDVIRREPSFFTRLVESFVGPFGLDRMDSIICQETLVDDLSQTLAFLEYGNHRDRIAKMPPVNPSVEPPPEWPGDLFERVEAMERPVIDRFYGGGKVKVEIGGGVNPKGMGFVNVDKLGCADVVLDLEGGALPFDTNSVDHLYSAHCLEHVKNCMKIFSEILRVCKVGADVEFHFPHWLHPLASVPGHHHVISDRMIRNLCNYEWHWSHGKKFEWVDVHYQIEVPYHTLRDKFPQLSDQEVARFIPGCCHEVFFFLKVVAAP